MERQDLKSNIEFKVKDDRIIHAKLEEFTRNWHMNTPFDIDAASLGARYDFVSYLMKCLRSHLVWGSVKRGGGSPSIERAFAGKAPSQCKQMSNMLARMVAHLGMPSVYVNFKGPRTSHWGLDIELFPPKVGPVGNWAFFDPTFLFCMKDTKPLNSDEISKRPELIESWHNYFNQFGYSFQESHAMISHLKQPRIYTAAHRRRIKVSDLADFRADVYIKQVQ